MSELKSYVRFTSDNPKLDFSFLYPGDWHLREVQGDGYDEVAILGPRDKADTYSLGVNVRVISTGRKGGPANLDEAVTDYRTRNKKSTRFQETLQTRGNLAGLDAIEIEASYALPLPINTIRAKETPIIERRIFFEKGGSVYEIIYRAIEQDYYEYLDAFKDIVRTFRLRADVNRRMHQPLVAPSSIPMAREDSTDYQAGE